MTERIQSLMQLTMRGEAYVNPVKTKFDRMDLFLPDQERDVKRICEYILNQEPLLTKYSGFSGFMHFDGSVIGDVFNRSGHPYTDETMNEFYLKHIDNLSSMDWQHGTSDYKRVLSVGLSGILKDIEASLKKHTESEKINFLKGLKRIAEAFIQWVEKCSLRTAAYADTVSDVDAKQRLCKLSEAFLRIAKNPPSDFYEAVLTIYVCFSMNPDSVGTLDRYLSEFYFRDLSAGRLTREEAKEYLQELLLMIQASTPYTSANFTRGGQSHFCIGGRDENGRDCYNELSQLIVESLMELDTHIPEISFRWTSNTPRETLKYLLACERKDKNKRLAFTNDDKRIDAYTNICGFPYKEAVNYTLVGCNEPAMLGGMCASTSHGNLAHAIEWTMHERGDEIIGAKDFEEFYAIFKDQLYADLDKIYYYDDQYNLRRAKDVNYVSCLFLNGCIENGTSITRGGVNYAVSTIMFLGNVTTIDSLAMVKQFVFEDKVVTMRELVDAVTNDWKGYEALQAQITKLGRFFGNDDDTSNYVAKRLYDDIYEYVKNKRTVFGYPVLFGDHTGYPMHFKWFGEATRATPDGRYSGEPLSYGIFQTKGRDRSGIAALMNAIAKFDSHGISSSTVTNFNFDASYVKDDESFEKTVILLETYLRNGGMQFQLNYLNKEDLIAAQKNPAGYQNLRVRVTGYSDYFVRLNPAIQCSIIQRYE